MAYDFLKTASFHVGVGLLNTALNGFASDLTEEDEKKSVGIGLHHFNPINTWEEGFETIVDVDSGENYCIDSEGVVRKKCAAAFIASMFFEPVGLSLNLLNKTCKVLTFASLWVPSAKEYDFTKRVSEWAKDLFVIVATPIIFLGMLLSSLYGVVASPYDGRKLFGSFERLAYSGGYQFIARYDEIHPHRYLLAPCFQPQPVCHLGGGNINEQDVW
ncbi:MAG: hypothetical protein FJZ56_05205 [Chlamydiae bacterium]|nr:hypothetical protein [Chlamydiota bacterium]